MSRCPCCGYEPEEEPPPLFPDLDIKPGDVFIPTVTLVAEANHDALVDQRVDMSPMEYDGRSIEVQLGDCDGNIYARHVDPNRRGGSW